MIKRFAAFAVTSAAVIAVVALLFGLIFGSPADHRAIRVSALIAYFVQLFGFVVVLLVRTSNIFAAWGLGMLLRLTTLADGGAKQHFLLGPDLGKGERPQILVPKFHWQMAEPLGAWSLAGCTVSPGFKFEGFELAQADFPTSI